MCIGNSRYVVIVDFFVYGETSFSIELLWSFMNVYILCLYDVL